MRTTIDISDEQHRALTALAKEALDAYLRDRDAEEIELLLSLEGSVDDEDEAGIRARIDEARSQWRSAS
jgi:hypothetical protein